MAMSGIWALVVTLVPVVVTANHLGTEFHPPLEPSGNQATVAVLVKQVAALQEVVLNQSTRIDALEKRLAVLEAPPGGNSVPSGTPDQAPLTNGNVIGINETDPPDETTSKSKILQGSKDRKGLQCSGDGDVGKGTGLKRGIQVSGVAFSAYLDHFLTAVPEGLVLKCNRVLHNDGSAYNTHTGIFTAPTSGVFLFTFNINGEKGTINAKLVVDDIYQVSAETKGDDQTMGGNTAILSVQAGQAVWLELYHLSSTQPTLRSDYAYRLVTFSGFLLY